MTYRQAYQQWLESPALSAAEREELRSIAGDEKEIEGRFFGPLEFGTAGLRGTMCTGRRRPAAAPPRRRGGAKDV